MARDVNALLMGGADQIAIISGVIILRNSGLDLEPCFGGRGLYHFIDDGLLHLKGYECKIAAFEGGKQISHGLAHAGSVMHFTKESAAFFHGFVKRMVEALRRDVCLLWQGESSIVILSPMVLLFVVCIN